MKLVCGGIQQKLHMRESKYTSGRFVISVV
jgi:hypothetical protein